jgi:tetratricopeptide (TPR) repeat protein
LVEKGGAWTGGQTDYESTLNDTYYGGSHFGFAFADGWRGCAVTPDTEWHHYAAVAVSGQADPILYIDGVPQPITFHGGPATMKLSATTRPLHIGALVDPQTGWFFYSSTMIDAPALFNRALSASEIQAIYSAGKSGKGMLGQAVSALFRPTLSKPSLAAELWSPSLAPGEKPDPNKVRDEANELKARGQYGPALERYLWYWNHALEYEPGLSGVRLSFLLSDWVELARRYPEAKQALLDLRARDTEVFLGGGGYFDLFMELSSLNQYLQDENATYELFKKLQHRDPALARQCFFVAEPLLVKHGDYALCLEYIGDPQTAFSRIRQNWEMLKQSEQRWEERWIEQITRLKSLSTGPAQPPKTADRRFIDETRQLIQILVKTGHKAEAEHIRDQALALVEDSRLTSAVNDAEQAPVMQ